MSRDPQQPSSDATINLKESDDALASPGQDSGEDVPNTESSIPKWHDFESQYSLAMEQSVIMDREEWGSQIEFLMSCIASAVGLGNIWRFPFIAGQNGGGAFLVPYFIVLCIVGRPLYLLELGLGQFTSGGPVKIWEMLPGFKGVGYTVTVGSFFLASFYVVIMGWAILYCIYSFFPTLPWDLAEYKTVDLGTIKIDGNGPGFFFGIAHLGEPMTGLVKKPWLNQSILVRNNQFFDGKGLDGPPTFAVAMGLFFAWFLVWLSMVFGVSGAGKVAYFTALFPYVVLFILLIGGSTLKGATKGLKYFFFPDFKKIASGKAWFQAVGQCFFSMGIGFGGIIMFASFNKFHHKLGRDIIIISIMDTFTSLLAGTCLFMILGHLEWKDEMDASIPTANKKTVEKLAMGDGAGMAFVTFPSVLEAFGDYPGPNIISFLFFFMIVVLAVGSANGIVGTIVTVICDAFPKWNRKYVLTVLALFSFFVGLIYTTRTGNNVIDIVDKYGTEQVIYMMAILEVLGIFMIYGLKNICNDFEFMLGYHLNYYWIISWGVLPVVLITIFAFYLATWKNTHNHPPIAVGFGWTLTIVTWCIVPITLLFVIWTRKSRSLVKRAKASFYPTRKWGPKDPAIREAWRRWRKTKPAEFACTGKLMVALRLRKPDQVPLQEYWTEPIDSAYQAIPPNQEETLDSTLPQVDVNAT